MRIARTRIAFQIKLRIQVFPSLRFQRFRGTSRSSALDRPRRNLSATNNTRRLAFSAQTRREKEKGSRESSAFRCAPAKCFNKRLRQPVRFASATEIIETPNNLNGPESTFLRAKNPQDFRLTAQAAKHPQDQIFNRVSSEPENYPAPINN